MTAARPVRVQLVDDHEIVRAGFRHLLEKDGNMQVVAESATGKQACRDYDACLPGILVMDISLPDISGLEAMRRILLQHPRARILMLSMHVGIVAERAMQMGARGFICKSSGAEKLAAAIHRIMRGGRYLDDKAGAELPAKQAGPAKPPALSKRELEICMLLTEGRSVAEIAKTLYLSEKTVYTHRQHIMDKLGVATTIDLVRVATQVGIFSNG